MKIQRKITKLVSTALALILTFALVPVLHTNATEDSPYILLNWGYSDLKYLTLTIDTEPILREHWTGGDPNFFNETVIISSGTTLTISVNPEMMMLAAVDDDDLFEALEIRFRPEGGDFDSVTELLTYGNYNYFRGREGRPLHSLMLLGVESWDESAESLSVSFVLETSGVLIIKNSNMFYDGAPWFNIVLADGTAQAPAAAPATQDNGITVLYNGEVIDFTQPPTERHGFAFYPLEDVMYAFAGGHGWNPDTFVVSGEKNGNLVEIPLRDLAYWVNGSMLNVADELMPFVENERTYVYLDFIVEGFGLTVEWDGETRTISIR